VDTFSVALRQQLLATGRFVAAVPASTLRASASDAIMIALPLELTDKPWPVAVVTLKNRTLSPAAQHFIQAARLAAKPPSRIAKRRN
jgi:DNA-binding transcriptional LysR family regulator